MDLRKARFHVSLHAGKTTIHSGETGIYVRPQIVDPLANLIDLPVAVEEPADDGHQDRRNNGNRLRPGHEKDYIIPGL